MIKISIIAPIFNVAEYLSKFLDSALAQSLDDLEVICVDDGSTDDSVKIIERYARQDTRVKLIRQKNQGAGKARNAGMKVARGEFVAFMDPDDMYPSKDTLRHMYDAAVKHKVDICGGSLNRLVGDKIETDPSQFEEGYTFKHDGLIPYKDYQFDYGYWRFLYRRAFLQEHGLEFPDYRRQQDPPFMVKAFCLAKSFYALKEPTYVYRVSHKTVEWNERKAHDLFCGVYDVLKYAVDFDMKDLYERVVRRLNSWTYRIACAQMLSFPSVREQVLNVLQIVHSSAWYASMTDFELDDIFKAVGASRDNGVVVSVIVPIYNVEKYLARCLDSILAQTFPWFEVLCVNDGSTDGSSEILASYAQKDARIKVLNKPNGGLSSARNWGMDRARGNFMMFVDSDDWIDPETLEKSVARMSGNVDVVCWGAELLPDGVEKDCQNIVIGSRYHQIKITGQKEITYPVIKATTYTVWNKLFKKKILDDYLIRFVEGRLFEDNDFTINYFAHCKEGYFLGEYLYHYMQRPNSIMDKVRARQSPRTVDNLYIFDSLYSHFKRWNLLDKYPGMIADRFGIHLRSAFRYAPDSTRKEVREVASTLAQKYDAALFCGKIIENLCNRNYAAVRELNEVIASLTSFPARIRYVHGVVEALLSQRVRPDRVVLTLCSQEFPNREKDLPAELLADMDKGLEILWTEDNLKPHKKYYEVMRRYLESVIITFDDDLLYPNWVVGKLMESYARFPHCVSALRTHLIKFDATGKMLPYREWDLCSQEYINRPNAALFVTGGAGALYPPGEYRAQFLDKDAITSCCLNADDVWMKFVEWQQNIPVVTPPEGLYPLRMISGTQEINLYGANLLRDENDIQINKLLDFFAEKTGRKDIPEWIYRKSLESVVTENELLPNVSYELETKPIVSVVVLSKNAGLTLHQCLNSLEKQTAKAIEIICVDNGSTDDSADIIARHAECDDRYSAIFMTRHADGFALNAGVKAAKGDYLIFLSGRDLAEPKLVESLVAKAKQDDSDVIIYNGRAFSSNFNKLQKSDVTMLSFDCYGPIPWNKAVRRQYLLSSDNKFSEAVEGIDYGFTLGLVTGTNKISLVGDVLCHSGCDDRYYGRVYDAKPFSVVKSLLDAQQKLEVVLKVPENRKRFVDLAFNECIRALSLFSSPDSFAALYGNLRDAGFKALGIDEDGLKDLTFVQCNLYAAIMRNESPNQVLLMLLAKSRRDAQTLSVDSGAVRPKASNSLEASQREMLVRKLVGWRVDCQYNRSDIPSLDIVNKGEDVDVSSPEWMRQDGSDGRSVSCSSLKGSVIFKSGGAGMISLSLLGKDVRAIDGRGRVAFYADYTSVKVNGREMLDARVSVWHNTPHKISFGVKTGETIELIIETALHKYDREELKDKLFKSKLPFVVSSDNVDEILDYVITGKASPLQIVARYACPNASLVRSLYSAFCVHRSSWFDAAWYLKMNPDVAARHINPAWHYARHGAAEGRDPGPNFSTRAYLAANPDVAKAGVNPLVHWERHGKKEGRQMR